MKRKYLWTLVIAAILIPTLCATGFFAWGWFIGFKMPNPKTGGTIVLKPIRDVSGFQTLPEKLSIDHPNCSEFKLTRSRGVTDADHIRYDIWATGIRTRQFFNANGSYWKTWTSTSDVARLFESKLASEFQIPPDSFEYVSLKINSALDDREETRE